MSNVLSFLGDARSPLSASPAGAHVAVFVAPPPRLRCIRDMEGSTQGKVCLSGRSAPHAAASSLELYSVRGHVLP